MQMSKIDETNNSMKESIPLKTVSLRQKSDVSSQVTIDRQSANECLKKVNKKHLAMQRIATWNVRTLYQKDQLENVMQEMQRLEIDVLDLSEVRWTNTGSFDKQGYHIIWSGGQKHEHGGFILNSKSKKSYKGYLAVSNRIILLKLKSQKIDVNLIQVYAPTMDSNENAIQEFYKDLDATKKKCKSGEMLLVMGDWNAKIGCSVEQRMVDGYSLGSRNERGDLLVSWCHENNMVVTNTWFKNHSRRLCTWRSPGDLTRNQIDYIL